MKIIFEDETLIVCQKEAGLAVENANIGQKDLVSEIKNYLKSSYVGVVHRLDMPVEGLLVFAKNQKAAANISKQLTDNTLNKNYLALVCGQPSSLEATLVDYLTASKIVGKGNSKIAVVSNPANKESKKAILHYKVVSSKKNVSLLDVSIETGRFHQIRAQLSNAGLPIVSDKKYGNAISDALGKELGLRNVALFANRISFAHPVTGKQLSFEYIPDYSIIKEMMK